MHVGLDKLRDMVTQVEDLRKSLAVRRTQLEAQDKEGHKKLQEMVRD